MAMAKSSAMHPLEVVAMPRTELAIVREFTCAAYANEGIIYDGVTEGLVDRGLVWHG